MCVYEGLFVFLWHQCQQQWYQTLQKPYPFSEKRLVLTRPKDRVKTQISKTLQCWSSLQSKHQFLKSPQLNNSPIENNWRIVPQVKVGDNSHSRCHCSILVQLLLVSRAMEVSISKKNLVLFPSLQVISALPGGQ